MIALMTILGILITLMSIIIVMIILIMVALGILVTIASRWICIEFTWRWFHRKNFDLTAGMDIPRFAKGGWRASPLPEPYGNAPNQRWQIGQRHCWWSLSPHMFLWSHSEGREIAKWLSGWGCWAPLPPWVEAWPHEASTQEVLQRPSVRSLRDSKQWGDGKKLSFLRSLLSPFISITKVLPAFKYPLLPYYHVISALYI